MHRVAVVAFDGVVPFDLSTPCEVFGRTRLPDGKAGYQVKVCGVSDEIHAGNFWMRTPYRLDELHHADTVILPGLASLDTPIPEELYNAVRAAARAGARIASICTGAFLLAATGLLDHRRATTHWLAAGELARRYPAITVDPGVLYVDEGALLTSAGAAAGLDLCLHMVRRDYGAAVAANAARFSVMPLERAGGQSQFIVHAPPTPLGGSLEPLLRWIEANLHQALTLERIAQHAARSLRTLNRHFREQTGTTPLQWLQRARIQRAQHLLETTDISIENLAVQTGFGSPVALRENFQKWVATSPQQYRRTFRAPQQASPPFIRSHTHDASAFLAANAAKESAPSRAPRTQRREASQSRRNRPKTISSTKTPLL